MGNDKKILVNQQALSNGVSGSCYIDRITFTESKKELIYLVDCGMFLGDSTGEDGAAEKEESALYNLSFPIEDMSTISGVFITHGHIDHIGRLPYLTKYGYSSPIYISRGTDAFLYQALSDTQRVLNKKENFPEGAKFSQMDVEKVMSLRKVVDFEYEGDYKTTKLYQRMLMLKGSNRRLPSGLEFKSPNVRQIYYDGQNEILIHYFSNGHLIGSASILLEINVYNYNHKIVDRLNILYTGDYKRKNEFFHTPEMPVKYFERPTIIVTESTYGKSIKDSDNEAIIGKKDSGIPYQKHPEVSKANEESGKVFDENVIRCLAGGGSLLVPVIALERTETILEHLRDLQKEGTMIFMDPSDQKNAALGEVLKKSETWNKKDGKINDQPVFFDFHTGRYKLSTNVPIYLVGNLATSYLYMFLNRDDIGLTESKIAKIEPRNFSVLGTGKDPMEILEKPGQKIILATPGMMTGGNSQKLGLRMVQEESNWIQFTSYVATGIARELINVKRGETVELKNGMKIPVNGVVVQTTEFSGHARPSEIMKFINHFTNIKGVIVTHGEPESKVKFANYIKENRPDIEEVAISSRDVYFRMSNEGIDKIIPSNLERNYPKKNNVTDGPKAKETEVVEVEKEYEKYYKEADKKKGEKKRIKKYRYNKKQKDKKTE